MKIVRKTKNSNFWRETKEEGAKRYVTGDGWHHSFLAHYALLPLAISLRNPWDTATSLNNLALLYMVQGCYTEAESLFRRSLSIQEEQLDANHPDTATSLNNLASLYVEQGRYEEAEPLYRQAAMICQASLGTEHLVTQQVFKNYIVFLARLLTNGDVQALLQRLPQHEQDDL
ncbi:hypothetical protein KSF_088840 [Reticulibacter mediterranei]|uniref:Tetratricopeptide repeat protein n=1 Tax=Reticulibacter mediterranei TaxID=2778369 RepID=A0A8J3IZG9_9CHLR|nr:tetratricopeptide repeat protein [Reticulibacter mediterranei]GHO98836.1 hypothetical protein KSF_088840 [Reticulibacter mediterranei]